MTTIRRFKSDTSGATAVMFGLSLLPLFGVIGAAVDYGRASAGHTQLQRAVDSAALALVKPAASLDSAQLTKRGQDLIKAIMKPTAHIVTDTISVTKDAKTIRVSATGSVKTAFMNMAGFDQIAIRSEAVSAWGAKKIELALVLDNTGSMHDVVAGKRKMDELKLAANDFITSLETASLNGDSIKLAIVPFNTAVKVDVNKSQAQPGWLTFEDKVKKNVVTTNWADWKGCMTDREQSNDLDVRDDGRIESEPRSLHLGVGCGSQVAAIRPMTHNFADLRGTISAMKSDGFTNITIGMAWGLDALSPGGPLTGASANGTNVEKIMIVFTDGDNTRNRESGAVWQIDRRTEKVCQTVKDATIRVYTIRLLAGNETLLENCASVHPDTKKRLYYDVKDAGQIKPVFQAILAEILATRLTN